jgi:ribonuclease E
MGRLSKFGLMEISRQRLRPPVQSASHVRCERCGGTGVVRATEATAIAFLRKIWLELSRAGEGAEVRVRLSPDAATYLLNKKRADLVKLETRFGATVQIEARAELPPGEGNLEVVRPESTTPERESS